MADINAPVGSPSWLAAVQQIEAGAPLDQSGPLPLTVNTLAYIPAEKRVCYKRVMDGSFRLRFIQDDDLETLTAHSDAMGKGDIPMLPAGQTPESVKAAEERNAQMVADVLAKVNREDAERKEAARKAAHDKAIADVNKQYGR